MEVDGITTNRAYVEKLRQRIRELEEHVCAPATYPVPTPRPIFNTSIHDFTCRCLSCQNKRNWYTTTQLTPAIGVTV